MICTVQDQPRFIKWRQHVAPGSDAGHLGFRSGLDLDGYVLCRAPGGGLLSPRLTRRLIQEFAGRPHAPAADPAILADLTDREREVVVQVARGLRTTRSPGS